jgi:urease accessory protein
MDNALARPRDDRAPGDIGKRARLELRFGVRSGRTAMTHAYAEPPFRVGRTFTDGEGLHLILASSAPGVFGGDALTQHIRVDPGAHVRLTSQSALQVHPSPNGEIATLANSYAVGADASLICEWDPVIPFPAASLRQRLSVELDATAKLFWSDAVMAGREARGERWQFERFNHELAIRRCGQLIYLERHLVAPAKCAVDTRWLAGAAAYFGSIVVVGDVGSDAEALHAELAQCADVVSAVDRIEPGVLLVRMTAASGANFHRARAAISKSVVGRR